MSVILQEQFGDLKKQLSIFSKLDWVIITFTALIIYKNHYILHNLTVKIWEKDKVNSIVKP